MTMFNRQDKFLALSALLVIILDQVTKWLAVSYLNKPSFSIGSFFRLVFVKNTGALFGVGAGLNVLFTLFTLLMIAVIFWYYQKTKDEHPEQAAVLGLILGGAAGNLIDRLVRGFVVDFIDFSFWPTFNLADSAISMGVLILIIYVWRKD